MARAYTSVVLDHTADQVWAVIRPFDHYAWAGVQGETFIEEGKAGDQVGAVRRVEMPDRVLRQQLLAHSDAERSYTYCFYDPPPFPVRHYTATIRVTPVTEPVTEAQATSATRSPASSQAFVEWWASFDCAEGELERWTQFFEKQGFAVWLGALRRFMQG
jgi:hypothetical protein